MARFRLRFLLQEIDLPEGETVLGRSVGCHVTVEDPLVSRRHARIVVSGDRATIEDLGSRNGLVVAGRPALGVVDVSEGARICMGTQELVLCRASEEAIHGRTAPITGFLIHCGGCGFPFAAEHEHCPHCGSEPRTEEATLSGSSKQAWSLELIAETLRRAEKLGRWQDVERVLRHASRLIAEMLESDAPVRRARLDELARAAVALSVERSEADWGRWALEAYAALGWVPPPHVGEHLSTLPPEQRATLAPAAEKILKTAAQSVPPRKSSARPLGTWDEEAPSGHHAVHDLDENAFEEGELALEGEAFDAVRKLAELATNADETPQGAGMVG